MISGQGFCCVHNAPAIGQLSASIIKVNRFVCSYRSHAAISGSCIITASSHVVYFSAIDSVRPPPVHTTSEDDRSTTSSSLPTGHRAPCRFMTAGGDTLSRLACAKICHSSTLLHRSAVLTTLLGQDARAKKWNGWPSRSPRERSAAFPGPKGPTSARIIPAARVVHLVSIAPQDAVKDWRMSASRDPQFVLSNIR